MRSRVPPPPPVRCVAYAQPCCCWRSLLLRLLGLLPLLLCSPCFIQNAAADGYVVCYALGRKAFNELLGPIEDVWRYETLRKVRGGGKVGDVGQLRRVGFTAAHPDSLRKRRYAVCDMTGQSAVLRLATLCISHSCQVPILPDASLRCDSSEQQLIWP